MNYRISILPKLAASFFILLFCYAAISKILDYENFEVQLAQSPLLSAYASTIAWLIIATELVIVLLLVLNSTSKIGLYSSFGLMTAFTVYIYLILNYSDFVPCSCGGILEEMGWTEHFVFNIVAMLIAATGVLLSDHEHHGRKEKYLFRRGIALLGMGILSAITVIMLFLSSEHIIKKENNFTRRFLMNPLTEHATLLLDNDQSYFAGYTDDSLYLGNRAYPQHLTAVSRSLSASKLMKIKPDYVRHPFRNIRVQVKSPHYYFYDGTVSVIYRGKLGNPNAQTISFKDAFFTQLVVLDSMNYLIRTQEAKSRLMTLGTLHLEETPTVRLYPNILSHRTEGIFDVDGHLLRNRETTKIVYAYTYRNRFIVMDAGLQVQRELSTIDTTETAAMKSIRLSDGRYKMSAPSAKVNTSLCIYKDLLFNMSHLKGKYESANTWKKAKVIDLYHIGRPHYVGSFYMYNRNGAELRDMIVTERYLYILIGNELIQYSVNHSLLKHL